MAALIRKCEILWAMLDGIAAAYPAGHDGGRPSIPPGPAGA